MQGPNEGPNGGSFRSAHDGLDVLGLEVLRLLGEGGMGRVYLARDSALDRLVAVKVLKPRLDEDAPSQRRFLREARILATIDHPHVVRVHSLVDVGERAALVMEYVTGHNLAHRIATEGALPSGECLRIVAQACEALSAAWSEGVIHRDVKPSNVLLDEQGQVKLADFGLARPRRVDAAITLPGGAILCTPHYVSPEQARGVSDLDFRSDLYSLGIVLFEMLTGQRPFAAASPLALVAKHLEEPMPSPRDLRPDVPRGLEELVSWLTDKKPERRPSSYDELLDGVESLRLRPQAGFGGRDRAREAAFVGREAELARLDDALDRAMSGRGGAFFVTGEAGTGKTALAAEFAERALGRESELVVVGVRCVGSGMRDSFAAFRELLEVVCGNVEARWSAGMLPPASLARIVDLMPHALRALIDHGGDLIGTFVTASRMLDVARQSPGVDPVVLAALEASAEPEHARIAAGSKPRDQLLDRYVRVLREIAARRPLLLVVDDLQWADAGSVDMLFSVGSAATASRILCVGLYRGSEVACAAEGAARGLADVVDELVRASGDAPIELPEEGEREFSDALIDRESHRLSDNFRDTFFELTRGHALFCVELLHELKSTGALVRDDDGAWQTKREIDWRRSPARVGAVIRGRVDRLPEEVRRVLDVASVEGDSFTAEVVARALDWSLDRVARALGRELRHHHRLVEREGQVRTGAVGLSGYRFAHVLFQKHAYDSLDPVERKVLHARVGSAMEQVFGEHASERAVVLARHFEIAGRPREAIEYLIRAATRAMRLSAYSDAIDQVDRALEWTRSLSAEEHEPAELRVRLARAPALTAHLGYLHPEVRREYEQIVALAERLGDRKALCEALVMLSAHFGVMGDRHAARPLGARGVALAEDLADARMIVDGLITVGMNSCLSGRMAEAHRELERSFDFLEDARDAPFQPFNGTDRVVAAHAWFGTTLWIMGILERSLHHLRIAVERARLLEHALSECIAVFHMTHALIQLGDVRGAARHCGRLRELAEKTHLPMFVYLALHFEGRALMDQGDPEEALARIRESRCCSEKLGAKLPQVYVASDKAHALRLCGRPEEALAIAKEGIAVAPGAGGSCYEPEYHRERAEALRALGRPEGEVENALLDAIRIARQQGTRLFGLRATSALTEMMWSQGRHHEARVRLAAFCDEFSAERHASADLQRARSLAEAWTRTETPAARDGNQRDPPAPFP